MGFDRKAYMKARRERLKATVTDISPTGRTKASGYGADPPMQNIPPARTTRKATENTGTTSEGSSGTTRQRDPTPPSRKSPDGVHYSLETCPMQCCIRGEPACPECVRGACVLCGRHTHRRTPGYCTQSCAESDIVNKPRMLNSRQRDAEGAYEWD